MTNKIQYRDPSDTTAYPSPVIWADCPVNEMAHDPSTGFHYYDSFENYVSTALPVAVPVSWLCLLRLTTRGVLFRWGALWVRRL